eukprot:4615449-Pyramimonas_sp.AAC.1
MDRLRRRNPRMAEGALRQSRCTNKQQGHLGRHGERPAAAKPRARAPIRAGRTAPHQQPSAATWRPRRRSRCTSTSRPGSATLWLTPWQSGALPSARSPERRCACMNGRERRPRSRGNVSSAPT